MYTNPLIGQLNPWANPSKSGPKMPNSRTVKSPKVNRPHERKVHSANASGGGGGKKPSFGMNTIESQLMDIIRQQDNAAAAASGQPNPLGGESVNGDNGEDRYSRKVFVGGLPPDIDEDEIQASFRRYGPLIVDWPHKNESKSYFPPKVGSDQAF